MRMPITALIHEHYIHTMFREIFHYTFLYHLTQHTHTSTDIYWRLVFRARSSSTTIKSTCLMCRHWTKRRAKDTWRANDTCLATRSRWPRARSVQYHDLPSAPPPPLYLHRYTHAPGHIRSHMCIFVCVSVGGNMRTQYMLTRFIIIWYIPTLKVCYIRTFATCVSTTLHSCIYIQRRHVRLVYLLRPAISQFVQDDGTEGGYLSQYSRCIHTGTYPHIYTHTHMHMCTQISLYLRVAVCMNVHAHRYIDT